MRRDTASISNERLRLAEAIFFIIRADSHRNRLLRKDVQSPSLEIFKYTKYTKFQVIWLELIAHPTLNMMRHLFCPFQNQLSCDAGIIFSIQNRRSQNLFALRLWTPCKYNFSRICYIIPPL